MNQVIREIRTYQDFQLHDVGNQGDKILKELLPKLEKTQYMVFSGTALGLYRDNDLIPTDTDLDFIIVGDNEERIIRSACQEYPLVFEIRSSNKTQQLAFNPPGILIDFHFYYPDGDKYVCHHHGGSFHIEKEQLDNRTMRETKYGTIPFPKDPEKFFRQKYGEDWQTPQYRKKGIYA